MITNFEEYTHDLTEYELTLVQPFIDGFSKKIGKENAITSNQIIQKMRKKGFKVTGARVRKMVNYIRCTGRLKNLISTSKGYYIATTDEEIEVYKKSLDERIAAIQAVRNSFN